MSIAAFVTWLLAAAMGSWMVALWVRRGGHRPAAGAAASHLPASRVFSHFLLAAAGLVAWIVYLVVDSQVLAWIAFAVLVLVAVLGGLLVRRWQADRRAAPTPAGRATAEDLAEQHFPVGVVVLHGVFAVVTVVLVLLVALGVGG